MEINLKKEISENDKLLSIFYNLGDGGVKTIDELSELVGHDEYFNDRLRYFHALGLIKNVAPYTLGIEKKGIEFYCNGGFTEEKNKSVRKTIYDILLLFIGASVGLLLGLLVK